MTDVGGAVREHLDGIGNATRRRDGWTPLAPMQRVTGQPARMHGSIVGFSYAAVTAGAYPLRAREGGR